MGYFLASRVRASGKGHERNVRTIPLVGGHPSIDFVNTCEWRDTDTPLVYLHEYGDLVVWARRVGLLPNDTLDRIMQFADSHTNKAQAALRRTLSLREFLYDAFRQRITNRPMTARSIGILNRQFQDAARNARIVVRGGSTTALDYKGETLSILPRSLVMRAVQFLQAPGPERLRVCERTGCGWLFLDHSRKMNRRWCSMQDCGNAMKQARFRKSHA
jgi:predicted RNA-binding Zn ribbon-like protein